jgi:hypothetical protein
MDEKKANLYRAWRIIHLQEHLVHLSSLSYNELASVAIDQERMMKAVAEADEKKRMRMMPGSAGSRCSSKVSHGVYPTWGLAASTTTVAEFRPSPTILTAAIPAATAVAVAAAVQPCPYSTAVVGYHQATTIVSRQQLSMLQPQIDGPLCSRILPAQAKQLAAGSSTCGQSTKGPSEGSCTTDGPFQLHHCGGDSHGRRSPQ